MRLIKYFPRLAPWLIWSMGTLFYCYEFLLQISPGVMADDLRLAFQISASQLGQLGAFFFYAYALMQIPVGVLLDNFGPRRLLVFATAVCGLACYLFSIATHFHLALFSRFLIGMGASFAAVSCLQLSAVWLPQRHFALLTGILLSIGMLGAISADAPLAMLIAHMGWRNALSVFSLLGFVLSFLVFLIVRDAPTKDSGYDTEAAALRPAPPPRLLIGLKEVLTNTQSWLVALYAGLMFAPTPAFGALWGVSFIESAYRVSHTMAATIASMLFVGWVFGAPFFGWLSDTLCRRRFPFIIGSIGTSVSFSIVLYVHFSQLFWPMACLFSTGFFSSAFLPGFALIRENNAAHASATAMAFMNMLNSIGAALFQPITGMILDYLWRGQFSDAGLKIYTAMDYRYALSALLMCFICSFLLLPFIKENHCQPVR